MKANWDVLAKNKEKWYAKTIKYWEKQPETNDGMLGGIESMYPGFQKQDEKASLELLRELFPNRKNGEGRAIDVGCGIGRVTKEVLSKIFKTVDMLEPCERHMNKVKKWKERNGEIYQCSLQEFEYNHKYDIIWMQWVVLYLTDNDFVNVLRKAKQHLNEEGYIVLKVNIAKKDHYIDESDNSIIRSQQYFKNLFDMAGVKVRKEKLQPHMPQELFKVMMVVLE
mmetsp:Transcript_1053/g.1640  ORF Transcript_1053/g.1640 Transcript_1053/m.1640 type:complete len:224 (+) Transcript_1053:55-726(+)